MLRYLEANNTAWFGLKRNRGPGIDAFLSGKARQTVRDAKSLPETPVYRDEVTAALPWFLVAFSTTLKRCTGLGRADQAWLPLGRGSSIILHHRLRKLLRLLCLEMSRCSAAIFAALVWLPLLVPAAGLALCISQAEF